MKTDNALARQLANYREYHMDHRNVLTHAMGIPLIVLAITTLLARPAIASLAFPITPALILAAIAAVWYILLDIKIGVLMTLLLAAFCYLGHAIASASALAWLGGGIGLFVVGWALQLLGHLYEGRKPAFVDDLRSFLVGPLFIVMEGLFALGMLKGLRQDVEG